MIKVLNNKDKLLVTIDGAIGESWFEEGGNTLKSVKAQILDSDVTEIEVNVKSMGGDLFEAFAIHDLFKSIPAKVTARIVGATASSGTVVAMGADEREIMPNAKFLVHNAHTYTEGNSDEHKEAAEALERFDNDIIDIYRKVTGKRKSELAALMKKEKWLSANEAIEWGFVDRIIKEKVSNQINTKMDAIFEYFNVKNEAEVLAKAKNMADKVTAVQAELDAKNNEIENLQEQIDGYTKDRNETIVKNAIEKGVFGESEKSIWLNLLQKDFESAKKAIEGMKPAGTLKNFVSNTDGGLQIKTKEGAFKAFKSGKISAEQYESLTKTLEG